MKVTNFTMITILDTLHHFSEKKFPQKISYAITRNMILLQKDYDCYIKSLHKLFFEYDNYIVRDEEHNIMKNDVGIPIVESEVSKEFHQEITNLLNIEIEIEPYFISEDIFNYEDIANHYDSLSATDIINLQMILCNQKESDKNEVSSKEEIC